jgi:hypothetical protein
MNLNHFIVMLTLVLLFFGCNQKKVVKWGTLVNLAHLNHLYQDVKAGEEIYGIVRIYSEYPDYHYAWEKQEGIACVDDAARAAVVYLNDFKIHKDSLSLKRCSRLLGFLLHMQAENGYFYNFVFEDHSINKSYQRSLPEPNWWSWRALWAITRSYPIIKGVDPEFAAKLWTAINKSISTILSEKIQPQEYYFEAGIRLPKWLIFQSAADQTAVLIMALSEYIQYESDDQVVKLLSHLSDGLVEMQTGPPYNAFLSWKNVWHGWGNLQAYSLLSLSTIIDQPRLSEAALSEVNDFYPFLMDINYYAELAFNREETQIKIMEKEKFPQIAYIIRPMVYACIKAYEITNDNRYTNLAGKLATWMFGANPAQKPLYNPHTGSCFDGIENETKLNMNSGAESTIEALLTLQAIEQNPQAQKTLREYVQKRIY